MLGVKRFLIVVQIDTDFFKKPYNISRFFHRLFVNNQDWVSISAAPIPITPTPSPYPSTSLRSDVYLISCLSILSYWTRSRHKSESLERLTVRFTPGTFLAVHIFSKKGDYKVHMCLKVYFQFFILYYKNMLLEL